jgi:epoxyqueuosine reductase
VDKKEKSLQIKRLAYELGFAFCGISQSGFLEDEAPRLERWLSSGKAGKMEYMSNHFDKRLDTRLLVPDSKSVISLLYNYYPEKKQVSDTFKISKYAYGQDYHYVIKDKMNALLEQIRTQFGEVEGRVFVDSAPVMDKAWAKKSGLGWIGKNSNLIHPKKGSFFFIAELILDIELEADGPIKDFCGTCTRCIDACPTEAIVEPYVVDGSKCISYLTIELKDEILPSEFSGKMNDWVFGCDVCQDVCPWNRFSSPHTEPLFQPNEKLLNLSKNEWNVLSDEYFQELFKKSAVKRTKKSGLMRNIAFVQQDKK